MKIEELNEIVNKSVNESLTDNLSLIKLNFQDRINENSTSAENFMNIAMECVTSGAKIGALAAISTICKLHLIEIEK